MSAAGYELEVHRNQNDILQNAQAQQWGSLYPQNYGQWSGQCLCSGCRAPALNDFELTIFQTSADKEPLLNYGAKLRLIMADPYKGVDLRDAIAKLKTALKEAFKNGNETPRP